LDFARLFSEIFGLNKVERGYIPFVEGVFLADAPVLKILKFVVTTFLILTFKFINEGLLCSYFLFCLDLKLVLCNAKVYLRL